MITSIKLFKESKLNENIDGLTLDQRFTTTNPLSMTVQEILEALVLITDSYDQDISSEQILRKLTPEICQEYVNEINNALHEEGMNAEDYLIEVENIDAKTIVKLGFVFDGDNDDEEYEDEFESKKTNVSESKKAKINKISKRKITKK